MRTFSAPFIFLLGFARCEAFDFLSPSASSSPPVSGVPLPPGPSSSRYPPWFRHHDDPHWMTVDYLRSEKLPECVDKPVPNGVSKRKVLVIGMDGLRYDKMLEADAPALLELKNLSTFGPSLLYTNPMAGTWSGPGWSTILTGVWPDKHMVKGNDFAGQRFDVYPGFLTRLESIKPELSTFSSVTWLPLAYKGIAVDKVDSCFVKGGALDKADREGKDRAVDVLRHSNPDVLFVYFGYIDDAGHEYGADSPQYMEAIKTQSGYVQELADAIASRATFHEEEWTVIVTTDHGHTGSGGHGGSSKHERMTFVMAYGPNIKAGVEPIDTRLVDVASTVFQQLGISVEAAWGLDGKPINERSSDPFDGLYGYLKSATDMKDKVDSGTLGWTHIPPNGFNATSPMTRDLGLEEWAGWTFTTDDFWTAHPKMKNNWRELNVRSRGVFAVADSNAFFQGWNNAGTQTVFNATLVTKPFEVTASTGALRFVSHHRAGTGIDAAVFISWDGKEPSDFIPMDEEYISQILEFPVAVPHGGAKTVQFHFTFAALSSDWYWAIDDVQVKWLTKLNDEKNKGLTYSGSE